MDWIENFDLFLFDLDGLLVDTEQFHFMAYKEMLRRRGFQFPLDYPAYLRMAGSDSKAPEKYVYSTFPELQKKEPDWTVLYQEKKQAFLEIVEENQAPLCQGAEQLLEELVKKNKRRCVVTHSPLPLVMQLKKQQPILESIPLWLTREDYTQAKPSPDGYLKAIATFSQPDDRLIGFEDSERGLKALLQTPATPILVNSMDDPMREQYAKQGIATFRTLDEMCRDFV
ncbi:MAG TPA: HAD family phosphatase [Chlamydiales bacterium]|nr:HAD family phosphatase [Chlamydiales bacterium]